MEFQEELSQLRQLLDSTVRRINDYSRSSDFLSAASSVLSSIRQENSRFAPVARLPEEILHVILSKLDPASVRSAALVSKRWLSVLSDPHGRVWKLLLDSVSTPTIDHTADPFFLASCSTPRDLYWRRVASMSRWETGDCYFRECAKHDDLVTCAQFSGDTLITGSRDRTMREWSLRTGEQKRRFEGHVRTLFRLQFDDDQIVSCSRDESVKIWNRKTGVCTHTLQGHTSEVTCIQYDSTRIVSGSRDQTIRVWDWNGNHLRTLNGHERGVGCLQFLGDRLMSGAGDNTVKVWDLSTGECQMTLHGHDDKVLCLQFEGDLIVSGSKDNDVRVWDLSKAHEHPTGRSACLKVLKGHTSWVHCLQFDSKAQRIVTGANDNRINVWCMKNWVRMYTLDHHQAPIRCIQIDEWRIVSGSFDTTCVQWCFSNFPGVVSGSRRRSPPFKFGEGGAPFYTKSTSSIGQPGRESREVAMVPVAMDTS